ncbi:VWFA and cache domain-containing protein 1-like, partial [Branchiostoma lanceolatum]|uniref:VWFA and cache domain-containing protein 1-like n=1 Tax=Branchiostoma lanceolatum TaxID=7740 RepID=UPI003453790A
MQVKVSIARGDAQFDGAVTIEKAATFYYEPIPDTKYSVVLCLYEDDETIAIPTKVTPADNTNVQYHRLDLLYMNNATGDTEFCSLYGEYAAPDESTIKFPPEAFADPIKYLNTLETFEDVVGIERFINDFTGTMANPGLIGGARSDAIVSAEMEQYWKKNGQESVWRYFGTENGVFRILPGIITDKRYDPTRQTWYARALSRPEDYTFSRPVPSPFGGGNMVTISRVISHTKTEEVFGVIAADITETYYYSMLYTEVPECLSDEYDCFLLDDSGYFMESLDSGYVSTFNNNTRSMKHDHLTHRFPWLAKYLTVRGEYLRSEWCNNYATQNSQLFYDTTGFIGLEVTTGPPCYQFALYPINATNTFILTLHNRQTYHCDDRPVIVGGNQNCSCNDICQTCSTEDLQVCQCPCVCDWNYESCTNEIFRLLSDIPCPSPHKDIDIKGEGPPYSPGPEMQDCEERCSAKTDNITCEALSHCDWCGELDVPACKETCSQTTLAPVTTTETPLATTTSTTTVAGNTPDPIVPVVGSCTSNPCKSGGTCQDDVNGYTCVCPPNSAGSHCETVWQSDKCYRFSDDSLSNQEASSACVSMYGHLANIHETAEQQ